MAEASVAGTTRCHIRMRSAPTRHVRRGKLPHLQLDVGAKQQFATARVAEHLKEHARTHDGHREWIAEHTENGALAEIRETLASA